MFWTQSFKRQREYLKPGRLEDLLVLIQVLGLGKGRQRRNDTLMTRLGPPVSRPHVWAEVARSHPEFFRLSGEENNPAIMLVARYWKENGTEPLSDGLAETLIGSAIDIHDRYRQRSDRWRAFVPILVALIGLAGALLSKQVFR